MSSVWKKQEPSRFSIPGKKNMGDQHLETICTSPTAVSRAPCVILDYIIDKTTNPALALSQFDFDKLTKFILYGQSCCSVAVFIIRKNITYMYLKSYEQNLYLLLLCYYNILTTDLHRPPKNVKCVVRIICFFSPDFSSFQNGNRRAFKKRNRPDVGIIVSYQYGGFTHLFAQPPDLGLQSSETCPRVYCGLLPSKPSYLIYVNHAQSWLLIYRDAPASTSCVWRAWSPACD